MKKLLLFIVGILILFLAGCSNGNQSHGNEGMGDSLLADPPWGYVIELKPLGNCLMTPYTMLSRRLLTIAVLHTIPNCSCLQKVLRQTQHVWHVGKHF